MRRGLTLVEVLAATVLLVMMTVVCVPLFGRAGALLADSESGSGVGRFELSALADQVMADPAGFGLELGEGASTTEIAWPEDSERALVEVRVLRAAAAPESVSEDEAEDDMAAHVWIRFTCAGVHVHRWREEIAAEDPDPEADDGSGAGDDDASDDERADDGAGEGTS